ncbi:Baseplate J-like protein [Popillia japonica]|uniref:Baseplate J-like protein n=1 Tax=Popillia japonica TaxID=7064 RepID=A0AAW1HT95_POPJA
MLTRVSTARDKRQGSIIYDTLAPVAVELAQGNITATVFMEQVSILTADGENLDNLAVNYGLIREQATNAVRIGEMTDTDGNPIDLDVGSRFSVPATSGGYNYALIENLETVGQCLLECETAGTVGNAYIGNVLPLFTANNLGSAMITGTYTPAEDTETDEELRARILERLNNKAFGGNVAAYKQFTKAISGVGDVKVFPVWDGGGTVKLSLIDSEYGIATSDFVLNVQNEIDPIEYTGTGMGIAPIGHRVTVTTPEEIIVSITAAVNLETGYTVSQLQESVDNAISDYLLEIRKQWADADSMSIYIARITAALVGITGINNVTNVTINGISDDLVLSQTADLQQLPAFGEVELTSA